MTVQARWKGIVIAESNRTVLVEGNHYFPSEDVAFEYLEISRTSTHCTWKGDAGYYSVVVGDERNENAAWYYSTPYEAARKITNHVAFWNGVQISGANPGEPQILPPNKHGNVGS